MFAVADQHGVVSGADGLAGIELGEGVGDAIGLGYKVEFVDDFIGAVQLCWVELDEDGPLRGVE